MKTVTKNNRYRMIAEFHFAIIGQLLYQPLKKGELKKRIVNLSQKEWKDPISKKTITFGYATIERWYYNALNNKSNPIEALQRKRRESKIAPVHKQILKDLKHQAIYHPLWGTQQHIDRIKKRGKYIDALPSYSTLRRYYIQVTSNKKKLPDVELEKIIALNKYLKRLL